ncbi:MAG: S4 domain-containing protein, partial [Pseudomonadota bacterium]
MRLNKFISETGMCSRREADQWITQGRVTLNGQRAVRARLPDSHLT